MYSDRHSCFKLDSGSETGFLWPLVSVEKDSSGVPNAGEWTALEAEAEELVAATRTLNMTRIG